jgi:peptidoglycan/xylan/chitin deacetylase (PgdA/CDA1 family)
VAPNAAKVLSPEMAASSYQWPNGKRSAFLFSVDIDAESPLTWRARSQPIIGVGELEQRRFGIRRGLGRILELLERQDIKSSFFVPGSVAAAYPQLLPSLVERGHEVGLHGYFHEHVTALGRAENAEVLDRAREVFIRQIGEQPVGYRSPAWDLTRDLPELLREREILYDSSLMGYDHPYTVQGVTEVPVHWLTDDALFFRFRGGGLDNWPPVGPEEVLAAWLEEWKGIHEFGGLFTLTVHPWLSGRAGRMRLLARLLEHVCGHSDVWFATAAEIAHHHLNAGELYETSLEPVSSE